MKKIAVAGCNNRPDFNEALVMYLYEANLDIAAELLDTKYNKEIENATTPEYTKATTDYSVEFTKILTEAGFSQELISDIISDYIQGLGGEITSHPRTIWYDENGNLFIKPLPNLDELKTITDSNELRSKLQPAEPVYLSVADSLVGKTVESIQTAQAVKSPMDVYTEEYLAKAVDSADRIKRANRLNDYLDIFNTTLSELLFDFKGSKFVLFNETKLTNLLSGTSFIANVLDKSRVDDNDINDFSDYIDNNTGHIINKYWSSILTVNKDNIKINTTVFDVENSYEYDDHESQGLYFDSSKPIKLSQSIKLFFTALNPKSKPEKTLNYLVRLTQDLDVKDTESIWKYIMSTSVFGSRLRKMQKAIEEGDTEYEKVYFYNLDNKVRHLKNMLISSLKTTTPVLIAESIDGYDLKLQKESNNRYTNEQKDILNALAVIESNEDFRKKALDKISNLLVAAGTATSYKLLAAQTGEVASRANITLDRSKIKSIEDVKDILSTLNTFFANANTESALESIKPILDLYTNRDTIFESISPDVTIQASSGKQISKNTVYTPFNRLREIIKNIHTAGINVVKFFTHNVFVERNILNTNPTLVKFLGNYDATSDYQTDYLDLPSQAQYEYEYNLAYKEREEGNFIFKPYTQSDASEVYWLKVPDVEVTSLYPTPEIAETRQKEIAKVLVKNGINLIADESVLWADMTNKMLLNHLVEKLLNKHIPLEQKHIDYLAKWGYTIDTTNDTYTITANKNIYDKQLAVYLKENISSAFKKFDNPDIKFLHKLAYYQSAIKMITTGTHLTGKKRNLSADIIEITKRAKPALGYAGAVPKGYLSVLLYKDNGMTIDVKLPNGEVIEQKANDGVSYSLLDYKRALYDWYGGVFQSYITDSSGDIKSLYKGFDERAEVLSPQFIKHSEAILTAHSINNMKSNRLMYEKLLSRPSVLDFTTNQFITQSHKHIVNELTRILKKKEDKVKALMEILQTTSFNNALEFTKAIEGVINPDNIVNGEVVAYTDAAQSIRSFLGLSLVENYITQSVYAMAGNSETFKQHQGAVFADSIETMGDENAYQVNIEFTALQSNPSHIVGSGKVQLPTQILDAIVAEGGFSTTQIVKQAVDELIEHDSTTLLSILESGVNIESPEFKKQIFEFANEIAESRDNPLQQALINKATTAKELLQDFNLKDLISNKLNTLITKVIKPKIKGELFVLRNGEDYIINKVILRISDTETKTIYVTNTELAKLRADGRVDNKTSIMQTTLKDAGNFKLIDKDGNESPAVAQLYDSIQTIKASDLDADSKVDAIKKLVQAFKEAVESNPNKYKVEPFKVVIPNAYKKELPFLDDLGLHATPESIYEWYLAKITKDSLQDKELNSEDIVNLFSVESLNKEYNKGTNEQIAMSIAKKHYKHLQSISKMVGVRIPTTGKHSASLMEVVGFSDDSTNSIFVPPLLLYITGADLDIDKMVTMMYDIPNVSNFNADSNKQKRKELANKVLEGFINVMQSPDVFVESITPVSTQKTQDLANKLGDTNKETIINDTNITTNEFEIQTQNGGGKNQVGIYATSSKTYNNFVYSSFSKLYELYDAALKSGKIDAKVSFNSFMDSFQANIEVTNGQIVIKNEELYNPKLLREFLALQPVVTITTPSGTKYTTTSWGNLFNRKDVVQTWQSLSDLTNAATDNGKNPILPLIGSTLSTSPLFSAVVMLSYKNGDIHSNIDFSVLEMFSDPLLKKALQDSNPISAYTELLKTEDTKLKTTFVLNGNPIDVKEIYSQLNFRISAELKETAAGLKGEEKKLFYATYDNIKNGLKALPREITQDATKQRNNNVSDITLALNKDAVVTKANAKLQSLISGVKVSAKFKTAIESLKAEADTVIASIPKYELKVREATAQETKVDIANKVQSLKDLLNLKDGLRVTGKLLSINQGIPYTDGEVLANIQKFDSYINSLRKEDKKDKEEGEENEEGGTTDDADNVISIGTLDKKGENKPFSLEEFLLEPEGYTDPTWVTNFNPAYMIKANPTFRKYYSLLFKAFKTKAKLFLNVFALRQEYGIAVSPIIRAKSTYKSIYENLYKKLIADNNDSDNTPKIATITLDNADDTPQGEAAQEVVQTLDTLSRVALEKDVATNVANILKNVFNVLDIDAQYSPKSTANKLIAKALHSISKLYPYNTHFKNIAYQFSKEIIGKPTKKVTPYGISDAADRFLINEFIKTNYKKVFTINGRTYDMSNNKDREDFVDIANTKGFYSYFMSFINEKEQYDNLRSRLKIDTTNTTDIEGNTKAGKVSMLEIKNINNLPFSVQKALSAEVAQLDSETIADSSYTVGDLYYLYMLLVNRSKFGKNKLTSTTFDLKSSLDFRQTEKVDISTDDLVYYSKQAFESEKTGVVKNYTKQDTKEKKKANIKATKKASAFYYKMIALLNSKFGIKTVQGSYNELIEAGLPSEYAGNVATVYKGKVYFNINNISPDAPVHEFIHIYLQALKQQDINAYKQVLSLVTPEQLAEIQKTYKTTDGYTLEDQLEEALVENLGRDITDIELSPLKSLYYNGMMFIKNAFKGIQKALSMLKYKDYSNVKTIKPMTYKDLLLNLRSQLTDSNSYDEISSILTDFDVVKEKKKASTANRGDSLNDDIFTLTGIDLTYKDKSYESRASELIKSPYIDVKVKEILTKLLDLGNPDTLKAYLITSGLMEINPMDTLKNYLTNPDEEGMNPALKDKLDVLLKDDDFGSVDYDTNSHEDIVIKTNTTNIDGVEYKEVTLMGLLNTSGLKEDKTTRGGWLVNNLVGRVIFGFDLGNRNKKNAMMMKLWMVSQELLEKNPNLIIKDFRVAEISNTAASNVTDAVNRRDGFYINDQFRLVFYNNNGELKNEYAYLGLPPTYNKVNYKVDHRSRYLGFLADRQDTSFYSTVKAIKDSNSINELRDRITKLEGMYEESDDKDAINTEINILRGFIAELQDLKTTYQKGVSNTLSYLQNVSDIGNQYIQFLNKAVTKANDFIMSTYFKFRDKHNKAIEGFVEGMREVNSSIYYDPKTAALGFRNYYREILEVDNNGLLTGRLINKHTSPTVNPELWKSKWEGYLKNEKIQSYIDFFITTKDNYFKQALERKGVNSDTGRFNIEVGDKYKIPLVSAKASQILLARGSTSILQRLKNGLSKMFVPLNNDERIDGNRIDDLLDSDIDNHFYSQLVSRNSYNNKLDKQDFEFNLENVLSLFVMSEIKTPVFNEIQKDFQDVENLLKMVAANSGTSQDSTIAYLKSYFESAILDSNRRVKEWHETLAVNTGKVASYMALGLDVFSAASNFLTNLWSTSSYVLQGNIQRLVKGETDIPSMSALTRASALMSKYAYYGSKQYIKKATGNISDTDAAIFNKINLLLERTRMLDLDYAKVIGSSYMQTGRMIGDSVFLLHSAGDAWHKSSFLIAKMIEDGTWDSVSVTKDDAGVYSLTYDKTKDKRIYKKGKYVTNGEAFEKFLESEFGGEPDFPYSSTMIKIIRKDSDKLYGTFSKEDQATLNNWAWGRWAMVFRRWMANKIQQYFGGTTINNNLEPKLMLNDNGEYVWEASFNQGIWFSLLTYFSEIKNTLDLAGSWKSLSPEQQNNIIKMMSDLVVMLSMFFAIWGVFDEDENKRKKGLAGYLKNTVSDMLMTFNIGNLIENTIAKSSLAMSFINQIPALFNFFIQMSLERAGIETLKDSDVKKKQKQLWQTFVGILPFGSDYLRIRQWKSGMEDLIDGDDSLKWTNETKVKNRSKRHNNPTDMDWDLSD